MKKFLLGNLVLFNFFAPVNLNAGLEEAWNQYRAGNRGIKSFPNVAQELINGGYYFTAVPFLKEYLAFSGENSSKAIDDLVEAVIPYSGTRQFEVLPSNILERSYTPSLRYILSKKYFRLGKYNEALNALSGAIPKGHQSRPFALMLEGSIYSLMKNYTSALEAFESCIDESNGQIRSGLSANKRRQLEINRDYCHVGIARSLFANGEYEKADEQYAKLDKASYVWPEILFEEAWTSFYQKNYNKALGKLVTYNAPIMNFIFNPEVDVLRTMTFMEL